MFRTRVVMASVVLLAALVGSARATQVDGIVVNHLSGQSFLTWKSPPGTGWTYHIYRTTQAPDPAAGLAGFSEVGTVRDSTWCDRRLSSLMGHTYAFVTPAAGELGPDRGLFVYTLARSEVSWYAVTCESATSPEDRRLVPGRNVTDVAAIEWPAPLRPLRQRTVTRYYGAEGIEADIYTLWTSDRDTPFTPAMCNRPSTPYDCAVRQNPGGSVHALMFHPHVRGGNFMQVNYGSGTPGEYVLTLDDYIPSPDMNTFWFGFNEYYDIYGPNNVSQGGVVEDYTMRRVVYTVDWARKAFPIDTSRVYVMGASMGGIAGVFLPLRRPDLIAASMVNVPLFDFSFESDPNTACAFGPGGPQRETCDHLFGPVESGILTQDGTPVYDLLNANKLVEKQRGRFVPPVIAFSGRYDTTIGWAEKPRFYQTMRCERAGGAFFFDTRNHNSTATAAWAPMLDFTYLYRFRNNLSFPAFSNCDYDDDPGDGHATSGDAVGTINGYLDWDPEVVDTRSSWSVHLSLRDLPAQPLPRTAPLLLHTDVTPRRLQRFQVKPGEWVGYSVTFGDGASELVNGQVQADAYGVVTVPAVPVFQMGVTLTIQSSAAAGVGDAPRGTLAISELPNPVRGSCEFAVTWPRAGSAAIDVFDVTGRRVLDVLSGSVAAGPRRAHFDATRLPAGVYLVRARLGRDATSRQVTVVH